MTLASGRYSYAICARCGTQGRYTEMMKERNPNNGAGYIIVHPQCKFVQPRVVQLRPDPTGLRDARPDIQFSSTYQGPSDIAGAWAAWYGLRGYSSTYSGPCCTVRRPSDNTTLELFIGYGGMLASGPAFTFGKGDPLYVTRLFDQSGNGFDLLQDDNTKQPILLLNGPNGPPVLVFQGSQSLISQSWPVVASPVTLSVVFNENFCPTTAAGIMFGFDAQNDNNDLSIFPDTPNTVGMGGSLFIESGATLNNWHTVFGIGNGATSRLVVDDVTTTGDTGVNSYSSPLSVAYFFGDLPGGSFSGYWGEGGVLAGAITLSQATSLTANQRSFWNF